MATYDEVKQAFAEVFNDMNGAKQVYSLSKDAQNLIMVGAFSAEIGLRLLNRYEKDVPAVAKLGELYLDDLKRFYQENLEAAKKAADEAAQRRAEREAKEEEERKQREAQSFNVFEAIEFSKPPKPVLSVANQFKSISTLEVEEAIKAAMSNLLDIGHFNVTVSGLGFAGDDVQISVTLKDDQVARWAVGGKYEN